MPTAPTGRRVALVTLGCGRNEVDSEELAGRLAADGWLLVPEPGDADVALVNTCGFVEAAKKDSVDTLLAAADLKEGGRTKAVVAVGCLAERYGEQLAEALPEADAVLGFDDYADISDRLQSILAGETHVPHVPRDRRKLLPIAPAERPAPSRPDLSRPDLSRPDLSRPDLSRPDLPAGLAPASGPQPLRMRLGDGPTAALKLASGCDRRCTFCAIPTFRGSFVSRRPHEVLAEAAWLAGQGVRELVLVSENSTSYGKDLGDLRLLESLLPEIAAVDGVERVRVSYLQPAEMRPGLVEAMTSTPGVVPYFDLSFQHASGQVLRRMRRFGDTDRFLDLIATVRAAEPTAGIRSNVIVGFPGETQADLDELERFLVAARLDVAGVFGYSDEDGTEAATLDGGLPEEVVAERVERVTGLVDELVAQRAEERIGEAVAVLVEELDHATGIAEGRGAHQGPEVDGTTTLLPRPGPAYAVGEIVMAVVVDSHGADLVAEPTTS
jgi:ribosomal protein S12 methylthiotransferase RimO